MTIWTLRAGADRRFRAGHPWVYSNELSKSPKGLAPGAPVELRDPGGKFLARGYGNPNSLIAFRALSRDPEVAEPMAAAEIRRALERAYSLRKRLGLAEVSHRLVYGEGDDLSGVVIDRYLSSKDAHQVFVVQAHSAGADAMLDGIIQGLDNLEPAQKTSVVLRRDIGVRKLEGLSEEKPKLIGPALPEVIRVLSASAGEPLSFRVDLGEGQKTGFFLDQAANVRLAYSHFSKFFEGKKTLRILDLCCYVGQWSAQLAAGFKKLGINCEVTVMDASAAALGFARVNVEAQGARCEVLQGDALKDLETVEAGSFDLVICDPPALIKGRKDVPQGKHAYLQLNTQALRVLKAEGGFVSCSCSALLEEEEFFGALTKAASRNRARMLWLARGSQSPDHPMRTEFPEGRYLKSMIGVRV